MINNIESIKKYSPKYIKEFMMGCTIEEKIDTHYITLEIISANEIILRKGNGNIIDRVDLILNSMWNMLYIDWNFLRMSNVDWFNSHAGFTIKMFYFPCAKPIMTEYNPEIRYIFDRAIFNNTELNVQEILEDLKFPDTYKIDFKCILNKNQLSDTAYNKYVVKILADNENVTDIFKALIDVNSKKYAINEPEGYVFKYHSKIFQTVTSSPRTISSEKSSYEFLLVDFIKYCKTTNYSQRILHSYIKTICNLFNDYIINWVKVNHVIENNITTESLESPYLGAKFEIGYNYIPDQLTKVLCQESKLYENIFKILLANLSKGKDEKQCIIMSKKQVNDWNNIMKNIKIHSEYKI